VRQLNLYAFSRVSKGPRKGCYLHQKFVRGHDNELYHVTTRKKTEESEEPNVLSASSPELAFCLSSAVEPDPINEMELLRDFSLTALKAVDMKSSEQFEEVAEGSSNAALERLVDKMLSGSSDKRLNECEQPPKNNQIAAFPNKLHFMLESIEKEGAENVVSWQMGGRAFKVHDQDLFAKNVMPKFFILTKYESLQRQLNLYGFTRIAKGPMKGCYHHPFFVKSNPSLCRYITRKKSDELPSLLGGRVDGRGSYSQQSRLVSKRMLHQLQQAEEEQPAARLSSAPIITTAPATLIVTNNSHPKSGPVKSTTAPSTLIIVTKPHHPESVKSTTSSTITNASRADSEESDSALSGFISAGFSNL
jgi:hypothetical protein